MKEEVVGVGGRVDGEVIERGFEPLSVVIAMTPVEGDEYGHEDLAGSGASVGLRAEADLAGNDQRSQLALGEGMPPARLCRAGGPNRLFVTDRGCASLDDAA